MAHGTWDTAAAPAAARRKRLIPLFLTVVFLYWIGLYLYVPTLPLYIQSKTSDLAMVGTALSMYGLWQLISRLPLGIVVDRVGRRKPFLVIWLVLVALGDFVLGAAPDITSATVGRALIGVAAGTWVPLVVMFSGLFEPREVVRSTALIAMVGQFSRIVATSANGWLNDLGGYPLAFNAAGAAALLGAALVLFLPDAPTRPIHPSPRRLWALATRRAVLAPSLIQALVHVGDFAATFTFIPILARQKGASDVAVSLLLSLNLAMGLLGNLLSPGVTRRIGYRATAALCCVLMGTGIAGAAAAPGLPWVFAAQLTIGLGFGLGYPLLMGMSIQKVEESQRNTAMGLHQSIYSLGMFIGPWLSGQLANLLGIPLMFAIIAGAMIVFGLAGARALEEQAESGAAG